LSRPKKRKRGEDDEDEDDEEDDDDMDVDQQEIKPPQTRRSKRERQSDDPYEFEEEDIGDEEQTERPKRSETATVSKSGSFVKLTEERLKQFRSFLFKEFRKTHAQSLPLQQIFESAEKETELNLTKEEIESALNTMQQDLNQIFVSNNIVILV
jgi:membrane-associated HD superfamily phosphohydrolase